MKIRITGMVVLGVVAMAGSIAANAQHWSYGGESGPEDWAELDEASQMCGLGRNQSPIDLAGFIEADLAPITFAYASGATEILNNGHAVQVNYGAGSTISVNDRSFELTQFHFHSPSENTVDGKHYPLEVHLVHADAQGNLAVVAVFFAEGAAHPLINSLWPLVGEVGMATPVPAGTNVSALLPDNRDYYRFNGSLTTPPCSEGVLWLVLKNESTVSKAQVEQFSTMLGFANNRPVQPLNARTILK